MHCDLLVIGLGYVGLPLAREATAAGMTVVGYDVNQAIVDRLNRGGSHVDDIPADDVAAMLTAGFRATSDESAVSTPETVVICVPTPLSAASGPDLTAVQAAVGLVGRLLRPGMLVVLESTTYPALPPRSFGPCWRRRPGSVPGWISGWPFRRSGSTPATRTTGSVTRPRWSAARHQPAPRSQSGSTASSATRWSRLPRPGRPRWPSCWRTPTAT